MSGKFISQQPTSIYAKNVLQPVLRNENFVIKASKENTEAFFHVSGKKLYDMPSSYNSGNMFEYNYYENGLLIITDQYLHFDYCGTTIEFFNNKGIKVLNQYFFKDNEKSFIVNVCKDKIICKLGNLKTVVARVNKDTEKKKQLEEYIY